MSKQKLKTHKGTAKRITITASGKLKRKRANGTHFLEKKSQSRKRVINSSASITGSIAKNLKRALGV
jgi:large subunit ribosomal protein L35